MAISDADVKLYADNIWKEGVTDTEEFNKRVYQGAQQFGVTADQLERALGWEPGVATEWVASRGLAPLSGERDLNVVPDQPNGGAQPGDTPAPAPITPVPSATPAPTFQDTSPVQPGVHTPTERSQGFVASGDQATRDLVKSLTIDPLVPPQAVQTFTQMQEQAGEISDPTDPRFQVGAGPQNLQAATGTSAQVAEQAGMQAATATAALVGEGAAGSEAAATQTQMDPGTAAQAALGELPEEALVQSQMEELTAGIESGNIPVWAQPAVDAVEAQLASRGLSRSSVGRAALSNAIIQAAMPMAQQNAQAVTANFAQDKQNQQQVNLFNAQSSQQLQLQSLSNQQQMAIQNSNLRQQAMLSDQASQNAASQFNASSENQTQQFMANLNATIRTQNAARMDAMQQFNAQQTNAMSQFVEQNRFAREQFNAQNATQIEQSNLQWRRQINQTNTAGVNAVNQANAMNAFNLANQSLTFLWQELRDNAKWSFEASENEKQRAAALAQAALQNESVRDSTNTEAITQLGKAAINIWKEFA